jgi:hypothetical protein
VRSRGPGGGGRVSPAARPRARDPRRGRLSGVCMRSLDGVLGAVSTARMRPRRGHAATRARPLRELAASTRACSHATTARALCGRASASASTARSAALWRAGARERGSPDGWRFRRSTRGQVGPQPLQKIWAGVDAVKFASFLRCNRVKNMMKLKKITSVLTLLCADVISYPAHLFLTTRSPLCLSPIEISLCSLASSADNVL